MVLLYEWPVNSEKEKTSELLKEIKRNNEAWMCMGDFNEVMWSFGKWGGNSKLWQNKKRFQDFIQYCGLVDLGFFCPSFTWSNSRKGDDNIKERLDRILANSYWKNRYKSV